MEDPLKFTQILGDPGGAGFMIIKTVKPDFPLDGDQLAGILALLVSYILGTALEDGLSANK